jgi:hypothetical protein
VEHVTPDYCACEVRSESVDRSFRGGVFVKGGPRQEDLESRVRNSGRGLSLCYLITAVQNVHGRIRYMKMQSACGVEGPWFSAATCYWC